MSKTSNNPYAAPTAAVDRGPTTLRRVLGAAVIGAVIWAAVMLPFYTLVANGTVSPTGVFGWIASIPLPGDLPDPRGRGLAPRPR